MENLNTLILFSIVNYLADKFKASIYERTGDGSTLMHIAAVHGHPDTAIALHEKGVKIYKTYYFEQFLL